MKVSARRDGARRAGAAERPKATRADAQRNLDTLLEAAKKVFAAAGVDAPVRDIAEAAGVGIGTVYRHFPNRTDLVAAVFRREIDACADTAPQLAAKYPADEALERWIERYGAFVATKRGLAKALHSGDPTFAPLPAYFEQRLKPALQGLLDAASAAGQMRADIDPGELLTAVATLSSQSQHQSSAGARHMVALLIDGLRYRKGGKRREM